MLKSLLVSALFAGLGAGLLAAGLQLALLVPLIAEAELYETGALIHFGGGDPTTPEAAAEAPSPIGTGDLTRDLLTVMLTVLTMSGWGMLLVAGFAAAERFGLGRIDRHKGLMWGIAGFAATQLLPGAGLPPEMPGAGAAELDLRQTWWLLTVAASAAGIALLAYGNTAARLAGVALIAAPHLIGAPEPDTFAGVVPPELSGLFAVRVLAVGAVGWAALGAIAGHFWSRESATG